MATRFYGINRGDKYVTKDSSTTGKEIELAVDDAAGISDLEVRTMINEIQKAAVEDNGFTI